VRRDVLSCPPGISNVRTFSERVAWHGVLSSPILTDSVSMVFKAGVSVPCVLA
jgi:hypothetical protein